MLKDQHYSHYTTVDTQQSSAIEKAKLEEKDSSSKWFTCSDINIINTISPPIALKPKAEQPQDPLSSVQGSQDHSLLEQSQGPPSLEYFTLKEILGDLVDLLTGNAPVINQLNHFSHPVSLLQQYVLMLRILSFLLHERANKCSMAVLTTLECHSNPRSAFSSLIIK